MRSNERTVVMGMMAVLTGAGLIVTGESWGGPLKKERVAPDANWVVHVDVEGFLKSEVGKFIEENEDALHLNFDDMGDLEEVGLNMKRDMKDFTAYGIGNPDEDKDAVIVATMSSAVDDVLTALKGQMREAFSETSAGGYSLQALKTEDDEELYFFVKPGSKTDERTVVLGHDVERVAKAVALVEGRAARSEASAALGRSPRAGSVFYVSAAELPWFEGNGEEDANAKIVRRSKGLVFDCGEQGGEVFMEGMLAAANEEDAKDLKALGDGLLAMARLWLRQDEELETIMSLTQSVRVELKGNEVRAVFEHSANNLTKEMGKALEHAKKMEAEEEDEDEDDDEQEGKRQAESEHDD